MILSQAELESFLGARQYEPHRLLGMHACTHKGKQGLVVRAFVQGAIRCDVVDCKDEAKRYPLKQLDASGFFEAFIPERKKVFRYRLRVERASGEIVQFYDPYTFLPTISEEDCYLFNEGTHHKIYKKLGAHRRVIDGVEGVAFAVWAPSAQRASVVGDFNHWDGRYHSMRMLGSSGIWELFIPGIADGTHYKYEFMGADGHLKIKTDPYATYYESPPHNASIVLNVEDSYEWHDAAWMKERAKKDWTKEPMSVYEVHLGSWRRVVEDGNRPLSYVEMATELANYVEEMGFTHVEFLPLMEHPFSGSWGYQVTGFYAPTHRYGKPDEFRVLVDTFHQRGIGVLLDWVPAHFPRDAFALAEYDGTCLYEHEDPRQGHHQDWGTLIFNYSRHEVRSFLIGSALSWFERYHIDGLRVDAVASMLYLDYSRKDGEWVANPYGGRENVDALEFLRTANDLVHEYFPGGLMIAEESTSWSGVTRSTKEHGVGFDFKWNMGWMHDTLEYFKQDPIYRKWHHNQLTFGMLYQYSERFISVFSHDEVVHGKGSMLSKMGAGTITEKAHNLRALYALMWGWPGKNALFMGSEFGQSAEWRYDASLDWHLLQYLDHRGIQILVKDLNHWYRLSSISENDYAHDGFEWLEASDGDNSTLSFLRLGKKPQDTHVVVSNLTPVPRYHFPVGAPFEGYWEELINTDATVYGGTGLGNYGGAYTLAEGHVGRPYSLRLTLPPLSTLILRYKGVRQQPKA